MKKIQILHNPFDQDSIAFINSLPEDFDGEIINWYGSSEEETFRLINMHLTGAMEGLAAPEPEIEYTDEDIETGNYPDEFSRWISKKTGEPYYGPCPRAFPSISAQVDNEVYLWDCPESLEYCTLENYSWKAELGTCLAGQWVEGAKVTANCKYFGNAIMRKAVEIYVKKYETITLPQEKELVLAKQDKIMNDKQMEME